MKVNRRLTQIYGELPGDVRKTVRGGKIAFREYFNVHAARLIFNGYALGVITGLGDTEQDMDLYTKLLESNVPASVRPYFDNLVLERLIPLMSEMRESTRISEEKVRMRVRRKRK